MQEAARKRKQGGQLRPMDKQGPRHECMEGVEARMDSSIWHGVCWGSNSREGLQTPSPMCRNRNQESLGLRRPGTGDGGGRYLKDWRVDRHTNVSQGSPHSCSSRNTFSPTTHDVPGPLAKVHSKQRLRSLAFQELIF